MKRFVPIYVLAILVIVLIVLSVVKIEVNPPDGTRMILEHTHRTYIAPLCFEQAQTTNNLAETTLQKALESGYDPESDCTILQLQPVSMTLFDFTRMKLGLLDDPWNW